MIVATNTSVVRWMGLSPVGLLLLLGASGCAAPGVDADEREDLATSASTLTASGHGLVDVPLRKLYRYASNQGTEYRSYYSTVGFPNYTLQKTLFYLLTPDYSSSVPTLPLYSLYNGYDHMDSTSVNEGGYSNEFTLGKTFAGQDLEMGLFPIRRAWKPGDHMDLANGEAAPAGYAVEGPLGYAWPAGDGMGTPDYTTANGVSIGTSFNWGGSVVSLIKDGVDYINHNDPGRELQSAMWYEDRLPQDNPTEAGDFNFNGSPLINYDLSWPSGNQLHTRTLALQWGTMSPAPTPDSPVLTGTEIEKWLTIENANRIRYNVQYRFAKTRAPSGTKAPYLEMLTSYLTPGLFSKITAYEWTGLKWLALSGCNGIDVTSLGGEADLRYCYTTKSRAGYVMAWDSSTNRGFALFKKAMKAGTPGQNLINFVFAGYAGAGAWLKLSIAEEQAPGVTKDATKTYNDVYVLIGSPSEIRTQAAALK